MELIYLWINRSENDCIIQQEFNFSPIHRFKVDNLNDPRHITYESISTINLLKSSNDKGKISNITAVIGANGAGKTTLLSFIATNNCIFQSEKDDERYEIFEKDEYEKAKSIYVFNENNQFLVYHNLEENLTCNEAVSVEKIYWNKKENNILQLYDIRKQLIVYLSNGSFLPKALLTYSRGGNTFNVNLHQRSMYLVADNFYKSLFDKNKLMDKISEQDEGFAYIIKEKRNDRTFQELLDVQYYHYLIENKIKDSNVGKFKDKILIDFDFIIKLIKDKYHNDFELIKSYFNKSSEQKLDDKLKISKKFYDKIKDFNKKYDFEKWIQAYRNNNTVILYLNLLFEAFYYDEEDKFDLPSIDFDRVIFKQIENSFTGQYKTYLADIKALEDALSNCHMNENPIDNPDDLACSYRKEVTKEDTGFYKYINEIFEKRTSYVLRYIRIHNINMSSGERAMQNMFSWLVLLPKLDDIMGIETKAYESKLILVDEIDLYSHPEWQRKMIKQLIDTINKIEQKKPVQIIVTSHSPLILSDFPRDNIIFMDKREGKTFVDDKSKHKLTFGANIYTLFKDSFFLHQGAVGEFARANITDVHKQLISKESLDDSKKDECQKIINMIGEDIIKKEMQRLYNEKCNSTPVQPITKESQKDRTELEIVKKQLEESLFMVNRLLRGE